MGVRTGGMIIVLTVGMAGCPVAGTDREQTSAVAIGMLRGAMLTPGRETYDPELPGYHLSGGIGSVEFRPQGEGPLRAFTLALRTSPAMRPNLEGFSLSIGDTLYQASPFGPERVLDILVRRPDGRARIVSRVAQEEYFLFSTSVDEVIIRFGPRGLELLERPCLVSWVDWYRR